MKIMHYGIVLLCILTLWGCGKGNSNAPATIDPAARYHTVPSWQNGAVHGGLDYGASKDMVGCQECHGKDFAGGISKVSCLNTAGCHGAGVLSPHPKRPWRGGLITHTLVKEANAPVCAVCHAKGNNLLVPIISSYSSDAPGCFNSTLCHGVVGHANDPQPWSGGANHGANPGITGRPGAKFSIQACRSCHATTASGPNPLFTNSKTGMPAGCSSTGCHDQNVNLAHPYVWLPNRVPGITTSHATAQDLSNSCGLCHGAALDGAGGVAPSCMSAGITTSNGITITCHSSSPAAAASGCTSCHGYPPNSLPSATSPNRDNKHTAHFGNIPGLACAVCHNGFGPPQATHANGSVNTSFDNTHFGEGAGIVFTAGSAGGCSNVSCHGGSPTPAWDTTARPNYVYDLSGANCTTNCHAVRNPSIQYIDVFNGNNNTFGTDLHDVHTNSSFGPLAVCTDCHGLQAGKLPQFHFSGLSAGKRQFIATDPMAAGFAAGTIGGAGTQINKYTYDGTVAPGPIPRGSCITVPLIAGAPTCHNGETRYWFNK